VGASVDRGGARRRRRPACRRPACRRPACRRPACRRPNFPRRVRASRGV